MAAISQWAVYQMCETPNNNYCYILRIMKDVYPELYLEGPTNECEKKSILGFFHKNFPQFLNGLDENKKQKEKQKPFKWMVSNKFTDKKSLHTDISNHHSLPDPGSDELTNCSIPEPGSDGLTNWHVYELCKQMNLKFGFIAETVQKNYPNLWKPHRFKHNNMYQRIYYLYDKISKLVKNKQHNEIAEMKRTQFTWKKCSVKKEYPSIPEPGSDGLTNWYVYELCKQMNLKFGFIAETVQKNYPNLWKPHRFKHNNMYQRIYYLYDKISKLVKNKQHNEIAEMKRTQFTWKCSVQKEISESVEQNLTQPVQTEITVSKNSAEMLPRSKPVDDNFNFRFPLPPSPSINDNVNPMQRASNDVSSETPSLPLLTETSPALSSASIDPAQVLAAPLSQIINEIGLNENSESNDLILAIQKFENLISEANKELTAKDAKIDYLKKEIEKMTRTQEGICYNLKRLRLRHLVQKANI